jgi:hypothetical protein
MTGGTVYVDGPTNNGNGAIDYQMGFTISGGTLVATGSSGMAMTPGMNSSQPSLLMYYSTPQAAGTAVTVRDESGSTVASFTPAKSYSSAAISAPGLQTGQTYTLFSGETEVVSFTLADTVTYLNESGVTPGQGMMPGGQMPGGQIPGDRYPRTDARRAMPTVSHTAASGRTAPGRADVRRQAGRHGLTQSVLTFRQNEGALVTKTFKRYELKYFVTPGIRNH